jgi:hypothetical protein
MRQEHGSNMFHACIYVLSFRTLGPQAANLVVSGRVVIFAPAVASVWPVCNSSCWETACCTKPAAYVMV